MHAKFNSLMSGDQEQTQTSSKEPWSEAAPWIKDNISRGQQLQDYYQANPFNAIQMGAIEQALSDQSYFRNTMMPGLLSGLNNLLGSHKGQTSILGTLVPTPMSKPGLLQSAAPMAAGQPAQQQPGLLNWQAMNPFSAQNQPQKPATDLGDVDAFRQMMGRAMFADTSPQQSVWEDNINPQERWMRQQLGRPDNRMVRYSGG